MTIGTGLLAQRFLYGVAAADATTLIGIPLSLTAVGLFACWLPARRAAKVDPVVALRYE